MMAENKLVKYFIFPALLAVILLFIQLFITWGNYSMLAAAFFLAIIALSVFYNHKPMYRIEDDGIYIKGALDLKIHFSEITEIRRISSAELGMGMRMGVKAPGVSIGLFSYESIGKVFMNTTTENNMVLIKTGSLQVIISPDEPDELIRFITRRKYSLK